MNSNNFETFGAHLRNALGPYANLVQMLEDLTSPKATEKQKNIIFQNFLCDKDTINNARYYLNHLIKFSYLDELEDEDLNWRDTELYKEYCNENNN